MTRRRQARSLRAAAGACTLLVLAASGCRFTDMVDQPRYEPMERSDFFGDARSARPAIEGTIARGHLRADERLYAGRIGGELIDGFPLPIGRRELERGRERFDIFCSPCHGRTGDGMGLVVRRGFRQPPSFHVDRLREAPTGHFYDVITNGFGAMYSYAARIEPRDRWAIVAYVRALQLSRHAPVAALSDDDRRRLKEAAR